MKQNRVCRYCGNIFVTDQNAKKFCRKKCSILASKKQKKKEKDCLCQWCGEGFSSERKKKFCSALCHSSYMKNMGIYKKTVIKVPVKITIKDAVEGARTEGITYGRYVSLKKIWTEGFSWLITQFVHFMNTKKTEFSIARTKILNSLLKMTETPGSKCIATVGSLRFASFIASKLKNTTI